MSNLTLILLSEKLSVCQLDQGASLPSWATNASFFSVMRTSEELSIVCSTSNVPKEIKAEHGWIAFKVAGILDFALIGILASIASPLAAAKISLFALSTYDTDYILIKEKNCQHAIEALQQASFTIRHSSHN